jgi:hypothetical protein
MEDAMAKALEVNDNTAQNQERQPSSPATSRALKFLKGNPSK